MKPPPFGPPYMMAAFFVLTSFSSLSSRDFLPQRWFENVPATDASVQQALVFQTVPGIVYTVQSSHDLVNWQNDPPVYGLGQQHVVPMREFTPPPPAANPPASPPALPSYSYVSLVLRSASGVAGGTVVSWRSLDDGAAKTVLITGELHQDWDVTPLYAGLFGSYWFFVVCAPGEATLLAENSLLGALDTAMLASLETNLSAMNAEVATSAALARLTPDPAPPNPNARKFWRILVNAAVDSDSDGTPDWAEFELAAQGPDANGLIGDPFNADTDGNGVLDGRQLDADGDGVPDALDSAPADATVTSEIIPLPRYAVFPLAGFTPGEGVVTSPSMVNDQGTVLYVNGTWSGGSWTPLVKGKVYDGVDANETPPYGMAMFLNDSGVIVGRGGVSLSGGYVSSGAFYWPSPGSNPAELSFTSGIMKSYPLTPGRLSHDGRFFAPRVQWDTDLNSPGPPLGNHLWNIAGGAPAAAPHGSLGSYVDSALLWGVTEEGKGLVHAPAALPELSFAPKNVVRVGSGSAQRMVALSENGQAAAWDGTAWQDSPTYQQAIDLAEDGTAIGRAHSGLTAPVLLNGKWTGIERTAPGLAASWTEGLSLRDTSKGGWVLATQSGGTGGSLLLLPLRLSGSYTNSEDETFTTAVGVDDYSINSRDPGEAVQDRLWIMAPQGEEKTVVLRSPLSGSSPLTLSAPGVLFNNQESITLQQPENSFTVKAGTSLDSGTDLAVKLELGSVESLSRPLGIKVMKPRTVKVTVHPVRSVVPGKEPNGPDLLLSKSVLEAHLHRIYRPQVNATFALTIKEPVDISWDVATAVNFETPDPDGVVSSGNGILDFEGRAMGYEERIIHQILEDTTANINVYVLGGGRLLPLQEWEGKLRRYPSLGAYGFARVDERAVFIDGDIGWYDSLVERDSEEEQKHVMAHEIAHIIVGEGHPDEGGGRAPLPGLSYAMHAERLVVSGLRIRRPDFGLLLVKGEWDRAVIWFQGEEVEGRMSN